MAMNGEPDLGQQALDKVAELAIKSQLDDAEAVKVDIETDPLKLVQGKVDSVSISGAGMVMKQELRVEELEISAGAIAIDPMKAITGRIELTQPTNAEAAIRLTEDDINRALESDYLRHKMRGLSINVQGQPLTVEVQQVKVRLPGDNQIAMDMHLRVKETQEMKHFSGIAKPSLKNNGYCIDLELLSAEGEGLDIDFVTALFEEVVQLLDLRNFDLNGMKLQLNQLKAEDGQLRLHGTALINQLST